MQCQCLLLDDGVVYRLCMVVLPGVALHLVASFVVWLLIYSPLFPRVDDGPLEMNDDDMGARDGLCDHPK